MFNCMREEAANIPACNNPAARAALEKLISIAKQHLGMCPFVLVQP